MRPETAISTTALTKSYGSHRVLHGLDLEVPAGTVFALLGPNGSGKTTTVRILSTLVPADEGTARIAGRDIVADADHVRAVIGVTGQFSAVDTLLTGTQNLQLMADLHHLDRPRGRQRVTELLEQFDLVEAADRSAMTYSGGMRRRLDLAMTLVGSPDVLFLDEPTTGLDPRSRRELWRVVHDLVADGMTVLLTTQYLDEADELADHIALLDGGRLVAEGSPAELKRRVSGGHVRVEFTGADPLAAAKRQFPDATADDETLTLRIPSDGTLHSLRDVLDRLDEATVADIGIHTPDLDDVFLALTGHVTTTDATPPKELVR